MTPRGLIPINQPSQPQMNPHSHELSTLKHMYEREKSPEADLLMDHRFAQRQGRGAIIHTLKSDSPCPLCRLAAFEQITSDSAPDPKETDEMQVFDV